MEEKEKLQIRFQAGKKALERGEYRLSIKNLEAAQELARFGTRSGGEVSMWLMSAYQAANQLDKAIALGQKLAKHPSVEIAKQSKRLLYIMQAPQLVRPREWMSEIPDLTQLEDSDPRDRRGSSFSQSSPQLEEPQTLDLKEINTQDNQFIWLALIAIIITCGGLLLIS